MSYFTPTTRILDDAGHDWSWAYVVFRGITGFPYYLIGSDGTVWGCQKRGKGAGRVGPWRVLTPRRNPRSGYLSVTLCNGPDRRSEYVHVLVMEVFIGLRPAGKEVCHSPDHNRANNALNNLRWDTHQSNVEDTSKHGTQQKGVKHYNAKLTEAAVIEIRSKPITNEDSRLFSKKFGVDRLTINDAAERRTWKHI